MGIMSSNMYWVSFSVVLQFDFGDGFFTNAVRLIHVITYHARAFRLAFVSQVANEFYYDL